MNPQCRPWFKSLLFFLINPIFIFILVFFLFFPLFFVDKVFSQGLLELYQLAKKSDPLLKKAISEFEAAKATKPLARSSLMPKLQASMGQGYYGKKITGLGPMDIKKDYWGDDYSVSLIQPVFDGQAYVSLKMASSLVDAQAAQVLAARQDLIRRVVMAYFDVLDAQAALSVSKSRLELFKKVSDKARAFLKTGMGDILSVKEADARTDAARAALIEAKSRLSVAKENLAILVHANIGKLADIAHIDISGPRPGDLNSWIKAALDNKPILISAKKKLLLANQEIEHEKRARWPRIDLVAEAAYANGQFLPDVIYREAHGVLRFTVPIYLGGSISAKTSIAEQKAISARHQLEYLSDMTTVETKKAFLQLKDSVAILKSAKAALDSAKVSMDATNKGYEIGTRDVIDVLDSTDKFIQRKQQYYHALYNHYKLRIQLKYAAGLLGETDVKALDSLLAVTQRQKRKEN